MQAQINLTLNSEELKRLSKLLIDDVLDLLYQLDVENDVDALLKIHKFILEV